MKKITFTLLFLALLKLGAWAQEIYYISPNSEPWGQTANIDVMNAEFGSGNWIHEFIPTVNVANVFDSGTRFVYVDASDNDLSILGSLMTPTNIGIMEAWVNSGGKLFLNCAAQGGSSLNMGFGGATNAYGIFTNTASITSGQASHPIFVGPNACGTSWSGNSFAHDAVTTAGTALIDDGGSNVVLTEMQYGAGIVMFGGMTTTNFHSPSPDAFNLRQNILHYLTAYSVSCNTVNPNCFGGTDGSVTAVVSGGVSPFEYLWSTSDTTNAISGLGAGTYSVTVTDSLGATTNCSTTLVEVFSQGSATASAGGATDFCTGGSVVLTASAGTTYLWSTNETTSSITVSTSGTYSCIVDGCNQTNSIEVNVFEIPVDPSVTSPITTCANTTVDLTATCATSGAILTWYDQTSGNILGYGSPYTTGVINNDTTFYVQASTGGGFILNDNFESGVNPSIWSGVVGGSSGTGCNSVSGNALYFNDDFNRYVTSVPFNTQSGGNISFYLQIGANNGPNCEYLDGGEEPILEYSTDNGASYTLINTFYNDGTYFTFTQYSTLIPVGAQSAATIFRLRQPSFSGSCCDHWAIDDFTIQTNGTGVCFSAFVPLVVDIDTSIVAGTYYYDNDGDTYGDLNTTFTGCIMPGGYVANSTDCNDNDSSVNPAATEICNNNVDDDCNTIVDDSTPAAPGNPNDFGSNLWLVSVWNFGGSSNFGTSWNIGYSGYYTSSVLNFDTNLDWTSGGSPSDALNYTGCTVGIDNHSWSAKREGFPCGYYSIDVPTHDDAAELYVNGNLVWDHDGCCDFHGAVWSGQLDSTSQVEFRVTEGGGGSNGALVFNLVNALTSVQITDPGSFCDGTNATLDAGIGYSSYTWNTAETTQTITINTSGTYSVEVMGCSGLLQDSISISTNITPIINASSTCADGSNITLTSSELFGNVWSTGDTTQAIIVTNSGTYSVSIGSCTSENTLIFDQPVDPITTSPINTCLNTPLTLTATEATPNATLTWYDGPGGNILGYGTSYNTGPLTADTTFYIQASTGAGVNLTDDFNSGTNGNIWASINGGSPGTGCNSVSGNALYFNDDFTRYAETLPFNTAAGGNISFYVQIGADNGPTCEYLDGGEEPILEYSTDGGSNWTLINTFYNDGTYYSFNQYTTSIPVGAQSAATLFRIWQPNFSGSCCDHWAIDNFEILTYGNGGCLSALVPVNIIVDINNVAVTYYADLDGDLYGNPNDSIVSCTGAPIGYIAENTDCNDTNPLIHDGTIGSGIGINSIVVAPNSITNGENFASNCHTDSYGSSAPDVYYQVTTSSCATNLDISLCGGLTNYDSYLYVFDSLGVYITEQDDYCGVQSFISLSVTSNTTYYIAVSGYSSNEGDYTLTLTETAPGISETFYADVDGDTYGDPTDSVVTCLGQPVGYVTDNTDCDDTNSAINPVATEIANGIDDNCNGFIDEVYTLVASQCGNILPFMTKTVYADNVVGATAYKFRVINGVDTSFVTSITRFFQMTSVNNYQYSTSYDVSVAVSISNGPFSSFGPSCTIITPDFVTQVRASQCGATLPGLSTVIADILPGSYEYKFEVTYNGHVQEITTVNPSFSMSILDSAGYSRIYAIRVAGHWSGNPNFGNYGATCLVTSGPWPTTQVQASQCNTTVASSTTYITANSILGATQYRFRVAQGLNVQEIVRPTRLFNMAMYTGWQYGTTYNVEVASFVNGQWSPYGAMCTITTPAAGSSVTQLDGNGCNSTVSSLSQSVLAINVANATQYEFKIENALLGYSQTVIRPSRTFKFSFATGILYGTTYQVSVRAMTGGVWPANFGPVCNLTTPLAPEFGVNSSVEEAEARTLEAVAFPNPFAQTFTLNISSESTEPMFVKVYDMNGKMLEIRNIQASEAKTIAMGENLAAGMYQVTVTQGDKVKTLKVIKTLK